VRPGFRPNALTLLGGFFVALLLLWLAVNFVKSPSEFYGLFLIGLTNGAVYGLVALGYSLVYGILELSTSPTATSSCSEECSSRR